MRKPVNATIANALGRTASASELREFYDSGKRVHHAPPRFAAPSRQIRSRDIIRAQRQYREKLRDQLNTGHDA